MTLFFEKVYKYPPSRKQANLLACFPHFPSGVATSGGTRALERRLWGRINTLHSTT